MSLDITRNKKGYCIKVSETGDQLHDKKWISKKEAKKIFIEQEVKRMVDKVIQIDMDFPNGFVVNGETTNKEGEEIKFHKWMTECIEKQDYQTINDRYYKVMQDYEIGI